MQNILETLQRWRTWLFNTVAALLISPDLYLALVGYDWSLIIPPRFMPYVTLAIIVVNVMMRPRPAVLPNDPEAQVSRQRKSHEFNGEL